MIKNLTLFLMLICIATAIPSCGLNLDSETLESSLNYYEDVVSDVQSAVNASISDAIESQAATQITELNYTVQLTGEGGRFDELNSDYATVDSFNGVDAIYMQDNSGYIDIGSTYYQCAEYVKRYYTLKNGIGMFDSAGNRVIEVYNLTLGCTPIYRYYDGSGDLVDQDMVLTDNPLAGDVFYTVINGLPHWAIVKEIRNGDAVLIEQNYVYSSGGYQYTKVNRIITVSGTVFYTLP